MAEDQKKKGAFSGAFKNLGFASRLTGNPTGSPGLPKINTSELQPQDSIPEIVGSPTDVGIYDGGHQGAKVTWAKFFEDGAYCRAPSNRSRDNGSRCWGARRGTRRASTRYVRTFARSHVRTFSRSHSPGKQRRASMEAAARADASAGTGTGTGSAGPTDNK